MFPQNGVGFIWDQVTVNDNRVETTIFVPESKKLFYVAIPTIDIENWRNLLVPAQWIEWTDVGKRDAARAIPLIGVSLIDVKDSPVDPEYVTQTTFKSVLLFPAREDLIAFVGEHNAWSPHVGIVTCDKTEINRDAYCTGYIERDYDQTESAFLVNTGTLKFLEGFKSDEDEVLFNGLEREIELAAEEATLLASKGLIPDGSHLIPSQKRGHDEDVGGLAVFADRPHFAKTVLNPPRWSERKSEEEVAHILRVAEFVKNKRHHDIIVYKKKRGGKGFVGYTPLIGSVDIRADSHKITGEPVVIGQNLNTRIEFNKLRFEFAVETVSDISTIPFMPFYIRDGPEGAELLLKCSNLDLSTFTLLDKSWKEKRIGIVEHPELISVLVYEEDLQQWAGQKVSATLLHYEGIEKNTPQKIRLVLESIEGLAHDDQFLPYSTTAASVAYGLPDDVESDDEFNAGRYSDEEEDSLNDQSCDDDEVERAMGKLQKPTSAFAKAESYNGFVQEKKAVDYAVCNESGWGQGGSGFGAGVWTDQRLPFDGPAADPWLSEGHGFEMPQQKTPPSYERGLLVLYSKKSSIFYTKSHKKVVLEDDASRYGLELGDSAEFEVEPSTSAFKLRAVNGAVRQIADVFNAKISPYQGEIYIRLRGCLTPQRDIFECDYINDVTLGPSQTTLKLYNQEYIEKSRIMIGHYYDIYVKFCSEALEWKFECIDENTASYVLEEEDEIDRYKRLNKDKEKSLSTGTSSNEAFEKIEWDEQHQIRSATASASRAHAYSTDTRSRDTKFSIPTRRIPTAAPSVATITTQNTMTTMPSADKKMKQLRKELDRVKLMLKHVWSYQRVQDAVEDENRFLFDSVEDWMENETEDLTERD